MEELDGKAQFASSDLRKLLAKYALGSRAPFGHWSLVDCSGLQTQHLGGAFPSLVSLMLCSASLVPHIKSQASD